VVGCAAHGAAVALLTCGVLQTVRLARWAGYRTLRDRLVLVLHLAYAFVPIGFLLTGFAALDLDPRAPGSMLGRPERSAP